MVTTPNMGLVLPDDGGSLNVWGGILNTIFGATKIDGHDHTTGKGVKIPAAALNVNAAVSWSSGGTSWPITDLLAIDFKPTDGTAVAITALAGALFVADGTGGLSANELYWRTTSGTNVKFTAGTALNIAAFAGGIGGDYTAVSALVVFDDATDSYWFQQQVGSAVRQYARMRSADVDLYEFKANPAAGVPTNRVRLASPAALAGSYALTFPAALPTSVKTVNVDATGQLSFPAVTWPITPQSGFIGSTQIETFSISVGGTGGICSWQLNTSTIGVSFPIVLPIGSVLTSWSMSITKNSASGTVSVKVNDGTYGSASVQIGATQSNAGVSPGLITLSQSGLSITIQSGHSYNILVIGGGTSGDSVLGGNVTA